ncbi:MAG: ComEA family DNA-binding protein [Acidimicrobiales bacterium]
MSAGDAVDPDEPSADRPDPPLSWSAVVEHLRGRATGTRTLVSLFAGVAILGAAWALLLRAPAPPPVEASLPMAPAAGSSSSSTSTSPSPGVLVHAAGAVATPGVHQLPAGSRVADLLAAAGGAAPDADLDRVNLAAPLVDGQQVWFPRVGELTAPSPLTPGATGTGLGPGGEGPLDLNTATAEQLEALPGIGPAIAEAIIEHRDRNGPFASVDDLLDVRGIGESRLADLRELVTV